jgi:hypothetical protein
MENSNTSNIQFGPCCFCGEGILATDIDPCRITVETVGEKWQVWFCHGKCFKERIVDHPMDLSPAHF